MNRITPLRLPGPGEGSPPIWPVLLQREEGGQARLVDCGCAGTLPRLEEALAGAGAVSYTHLLWGTPLRYDGNSDWGYYVRRMDAAVILRAAVAAVFAPAVIAAAFGAPLGRWYVTAGLIVLALFLGSAIARLLGPAQRRG